MKRHFFKQSLLRTMMIVATLLFMMPAQNAWADNVATATVDGNTYTYSSLEAAVSAANGAQSTATVTLLKDITEQPCSLEVRKPMIIDLNNHRINTTTNYSLFYIELSMGQQMTIKNGSIRGRQNDVYIYKGEAVLENITAEAPSSGSDCVYICNTCTLTVSKRITFDASIDNSGIVKIASGQKLYDKNGIEYSGYINSRVANLANNTLSSLVTVTANGITDTYNSLESAVSAATYAYINYGTAATVKLNHDITQQTCSLEVKKPMIIDLNNHRINSTANFSLFYIYLSNGQQMTIKNGSIRGTEYDVYIYKGEAVLENITAEAPSSGSNCVGVCNTCTLTVSKRITFDASIDNSGIVKIASGQTLYDKNGIDYYGNLNSSRVANLANNTLSSLVTVTANGITDTYNSLQDAVSAAANAYTTYGTAATITLNHDITEQPCSLEVRKPMIIDLNGHVVNADNLTYAYGIFSIMNAEGQVIIKNGTISRRGVNDYNGFAIYNYNSNVELENVTVKNTYSTDNPCLYNNGTLTISKNITLVGSIKNSGTVQIVDGQLLGDASGKYYHGTLTSAQVDALSNNTLSSLSVVASGSCGTYVKWALTGTSPNYTLYISGMGNMADYSLTNRPWVNYLAGIVTVVIEDGVESIGSDAFRNCTSLESVTIPASVTSIGASAFQKCSSLTSISIPASVTSIGENAFYDTGLTSITIPASVTSIGQSAFYGCKLTSITLNEGLTTISAYAFSNNGTTIESVSIPQSVTSIGNCAFNGTSVQNFYINNVPSVLSIGENSPFKSSGVTIHVYTQMKSIFENATNWSKYEGHFVGDIDFTSVTSVTLDNESMIVKTNASGKLNATINPAGASVKNVVFTSSNDNLVQITNAATGEFEAGSQNGTATITCTALDGSGAYATCNVEVNNYLTPAESVTLNKTTNSLEVGNQFNLTATIAPGNATFKNVSWRTSDETVATVNDGTVTAVAPGVATITAISQDGQARANCVVSVIGSCGTDVTWVLTGTSPNYTLTISGTGAMSTSPWYNYRADITTVIINNGVTGIDTEFMNTPNLTSVTIPASVTLICQQAFDGCTNLETVSGCEGVTDVGNDAFSDTKWLMDQPDGVVYIGKVAYLGKNVSGEVNIKAGTVSISSDAFNDCTNLTSITIPNSVTDIGSSAFYKCTGLTSITIPNGVKEIYEYTFQGCTSLTSITIPNGVTEIRDNAFYQTGLTSINIPNSVTHIGNYTFYGCTSLTSVTIPSSVESIGEAAFYDSGLTSITIPNSVMYIDANTFFGCSNLATVTIGSGVERIGESAFYSCSKLETVTVYAPNCSLDNYAFNFCDKLANIYVFRDRMDYYLTNWGNYSSIIKGMTGGYCGADDPQTYEDESLNVTWALTGTSPNYTLTISGTGAMKDYGAPDDLPWKDYRSLIASVVIENGVTSIGNMAFEGCTSLKSVTIPVSVERIGDFAFAYCTNLASVTIPVASLTYYGVSAFDNTAAGLKIYVPGSALSTYEAATNWSAYKNNDNFVGVYTLTYDLAGGTLPAGKSNPESYTAEDKNFLLNNPTKEGYAFVGWNYDYTEGNNTFNHTEVFVEVVPFWEQDLSFTATWVAEDETHKDLAKCRAEVDNPLYRGGTGNYVGYYYDGGNGIKVYDGETLLTYGTDYSYSVLVSLDGGDCDDMGEHCRVLLTGEGNYVGGLSADVVIVANSVNGKWGDLKWAYDNGTLTISRKDGVTEDVVMDPMSSTGEGYDSWLGIGSGIFSIVFEEGVKTIAETAFGYVGDGLHHYSNLATISLPSSLTEIGANAFAHCDGLTVDLDDILAKNITLGNNAFYKIGCLAGSLANMANNATKIALLYQAARANVTLSDRTLYKDGNWNTLCLPFALGNAMADEGHHFDGTPLEGATVMELKVADSEFDAASGTLSLFFTDAKSISAGTPYIVKWEGDGTNNLVNPLFTGVKVFTDAPTPVQSYDKKVQFRGIYSPTNIYSASKDNLFLGIGKNNQNEDVSMLFWPSTTDYTLGAFRAYFHVDLTETNGVRDIVLNFEDGTQTTGIIGHTEITETTERADAAWYTINGVRLSAKPTAKGLYVHGGRKVVIK